MASTIDEQTEKTTFTDGVTGPDGKPYRYTPREKKFVFEYLTDPKHIAWRAAERAGYGGKPATLRVVASALMKKPHITAAINAAFESLTMPRFEILYRLGRVAAGSIADVLNEDNELDLDLAKEQGTDFLIKKIQRERRVIEVKTESDMSGDGETLERSIISETVKFEIHDPLRALELLGKHSRLFVENVQKLNRNGEPADDDSEPKVILFLPDNGRDPGQRPARRKRKTTKKK